MLFSLRVTLLSRCIVRISEMSTSTSRLSTRHQYRWYWYRNCNWNWYRGQTKIKGIPTVVCQHAEQSGKQQQQQQEEHLPQRQAQTGSRRTNRQTIRSRYYWNTKVGIWQSSSSADVDDCHRHLCGYGDEGICVVHGLQECQGVGKMHGILVNATASMSYKKQLLQQLLGWWFGFRYHLHFTTLVYFAVGCLT